MGDVRDACKSFVGIPEGNRPLGRPRRKGKDNIRTDLGELGWENVDWMLLIQDRNLWRARVNTVVNFGVP
jgi:hypothetical protein